MLELLRIGTHLESFLKLFQPELKLLRRFRFYRGPLQGKIPEIPE